MKMNVCAVLALFFAGTLAFAGFETDRVTVDRFCQLDSIQEKLRCFPELRFQDLNHDDQEQIWSHVMNIHSPTNSAQWHLFFSDLSALVRHLVEKRSDVTNGTWLVGLAIHMERFAMIDTAFYTNGIQRAFDADRRLVSPDGKYHRRTGTHAKFGPNMMTLKKRFSRAQNWNEQVRKYRRELLGVVRDSIGRWGPVWSDHSRRMMREFARRAKLTPEEERFLRGSHTP